MNGIPDWLRGDSAPRRNHFYFGKMMGVAQFDREQRYGLAHRWMINRLSLGTGILCGLDAASDAADAKRIIVKPGVAIDPLGREIVVPHVVRFDPFATAVDCGCAESAGPIGPGTYQLCLRYRECEADFSPLPREGDCDSESDCAADTTVETYCLGLSAVAGRAEKPCGPPPAELSCRDLQEGLSFGDAGTEPGSPPPPPPTLTDIRDLLIVLVNGARQSIGESLGVVLGTVTVGAGGTIVGVEPAGRQHLYSQAEIMRVLVAVTECVARCCGSDHPTPIEPLRITRIDYLFSPTGDQSAHEVLADTTPRTFEVAADGSDDRRLTGFHVSFDRPVDVNSLATGITVTIGSLPTGVTAVPFTIGTNLDATEVDVLFDEGNIGPGRYTVTLFGDEQKGIRTVPANGSVALVLDGTPNFVPGSATELAWPAGRPAGPGTQRGNFTWDFNCRLPVLRVLSIDMTTDNRPDTKSIAGMDPYHIEWQGDTVRLDIEFSTPIHEFSNNEIEVVPPANEVVPLSPVPSRRYRVVLGRDEHKVTLHGRSNSDSPPLFLPIVSATTFAGQPLALDGELDDKDKLKFPSGKSGAGRDLELGVIRTPQP